MDMLDGNDDDGHAGAAEVKKEPGDSMPEGAQGAGKRTREASGGEIDEPKQKAQKKAAGAGNKKN